MMQTVLCDSWQTICFQCMNGLTSNPKKKERKVKVKTKVEGKGLHPEHQTPNRKP